MHHAGSWGEDLAEPVSDSGNSRTEPQPLYPIQPGAVNKLWQTQPGLENAGLPLVALAHWPCSRQ